MVGICLSGGGARGMAHIGVLKALEEHAISPKYISGASAGSIIGSLYAAGLSPDEILEIASKQSLFKAFRLGFSGMGLTNLNHLRGILEEHIKYDDFDQLRKKLFVCVSNMNKGLYEILDSGKLFDAVVASSSIPIFFDPVEINGQRYADGGLLNNLPVEPLKGVCDLVIGVNVMPYGPVEPDNLNSMVEMGYRVMDLVVWSNVKSRIVQCDVVIESEGVYEYGLFDFGKSKEIYELGYQAALKQIPNILKATL